jgi:hypothetical protein
VDGSTAVEYRGRPLFINRLRAPRVRYSLFKGTARHVFNLCQARGRLSMGIIAGSVGENNYESRHFVFDSVLIPIRLCRTPNRI